MIRITGEGLPYLFSVPWFSGPACGPSDHRVCAKQLKVPLLLCEDDSDLSLVLVNLQILRTLGAVIPKKQVQRAHLHHLL